VSLRASLRVLPVGVLCGGVAVAMAFYHKGLFPLGQGVRIGHFVLPFYLLFAYPLMVLLGTLAGFFIVPMNALLQHRGATLLSAGHSIAVQNFNQNLAVLLMLGAYALLLTAKMPAQWIIVVFGSFIAVMIGLAMRRSAANARTVDLRALVDE
jgi:MFS transporter, LPLT family, lysophospholipid transporter